MDSYSLIIFGITGNLAQIKLIPALYDMEEKNLLPQNISIIGVSRKQMSPHEFGDYIDKTLHLKNHHHLHDIKDDVVKRLIAKMSFTDGDLDDPNFYPKLNDQIKTNNRIYYLATYPDLYAIVFENLQKNSMNVQEKGFIRLIIEKPIGHDLSSAKELNELLLKYFSEDQIFRIDHYLGKETIQNILTFRFANGIFEHLMNKDFVDSIQITASEDFGVGDRGSYYDSVGALKDVGQNHQLQMLAFATMDCPQDLSNENVTKERIKILESLKPEKIVFGQYQGYLDEKNVANSSKTDTFYALKAQIDNDRWQGVPIYIRAGKRLEKTITEVSIIFKTPNNRLIDDLKSGEEPNILIYRIFPNEGIILKFLAKRPGSKMQLDPSYMQFCYRNLKESLPDPYEQLLSDAVRGDQTFFNDAREVEAQWAFTDPLSSQRTEPLAYQPGSWGPKEADELIKEDGREWLEPSNEFCAL